MLSTFIKRLAFKMHKDKKPTYKAPSLSNNTTKLHVNMCCREVSKVDLTVWMERPRCIEGAAYLALWRRGNHFHQGFLMTSSIFKTIYLFTLIYTILFQGLHLQAQHKAAYRY